MSNQTERRKLPRGEKPTIVELRACFHRIWSSQVGTKEYKKKDWTELVRMLFQFGVKV